MNDLPDPAGRRYADAETELILRRAAELQGMAEPPTSPTLTDLQQIADEAGIEPRYVRQAAAELAVPSPATGIADTSASLRLERVLDGEVPASELDAMVEAICSATGMAGQATVVGRGFTWISGGHPGHPTPPRVLTITVTARDGRTVIRVDEPRAQMAFNEPGMGVLSALVGGVLVTGWVGYPPVAGMIAGVASGGAVLAARRIHRRATERRREWLAALLERVAERAERLIVAPPEPGSTPPAVR